MRDLGRRRRKKSSLSLSSFAKQNKASWAEQASLDRSRGNDSLKADAGLLRKQSPKAFFLLPSSEISPLGCFFFFALLLLLFSLSLLSSSLFVVGSHTNTETKN